MLLKTFKSSVKKFVPQDIIDGIQIKLGKKIRVWDTQQVNAAQKNFYPEAQIIETPRWAPTVFTAFYNGTSADKIIPPAGMAFAQSWVPFSKGKTSVLIYNFFERNYLIKDPILYRFVLLGENSRVLSTKNIILGPNAVHLTDSLIGNGLRAADLPDDASLVIQAFHPRIRVPADQLRYFVFLGSSSKEINCGGHALQMRPINPPTSLQYRRFGPTTGMFAYALGQSNHPLQPEAENGKIGKLSAGRVFNGNVFFVHKDAEGSPLALWHDGPSNRVEPTAAAKTLGECRTCLNVPSFQDHAPFVLVSSSQVGFRPEKISFDAADSMGRIVATRTAELRDDNAIVDLKDVFSADQLTGNICVTAKFNKDNGDFSRVPIAYLHVYYRSRHGFSDQVHSHHTFGFSNSPIKAGPFRCKKFAPLIKKQGLTFLYSVVNEGGIKENKDDFIFIRVISDTGVERKIRFPVRTFGATWISGDELLKKMGDDINEAAIVQYEHTSTNFNGSWFILNEANGTLAVDHFTGG